MSFQHWRARNVNRGTNDFVTGNVSPTADKINAIVRPVTGNITTDDVTVWVPPFFVFDNFILFIPH